MFGWLKGLVTGIAVKVLEEFGTFLATQLAKDVAELLPYARKAVKAAAKNAAGKSNDEKFEAARKALAEETGKQLDELSDSAVNKALEVAHGEMSDLLDEIENEALKKAK